MGPPVRSIVAGNAAVSFLALVHETDNKCNEVAAEQFQFHADKRLLFERNLEGLAKYATRLLKVWRKEKASKPSKSGNSAAHSFV